MDKVDAKATFMKRMRGKRIFEIQGIFVHQEKDNFFLQKTDLRFSLPSVLPLDRTTRCNKEYYFTFWLENLQRIVIAINSTSLIQN